MSLPPVFGRAPLRRRAEVPAGTRTTKAPTRTRVATGTNANLNLESRFAGFHRHTA
jgi:hypothetical protein